MVDCHKNGTGERCGEKARKNWMARPAALAGPPRGQAGEVEAAAKARFNFLLLQELDEEHQAVHIGWTEGGVNEGWLVVLKVCVL